MSESRDLILALLRSHPVDPQNSYTAPYETSQSGMQETIGLSRAVVSKNLQEMESDGLIDKTQLHVKGKKGRVNTYYLTPKGWSKSKAGGGTV